MNRWLERSFLLLIFSLGFMQPGLNAAGTRTMPTDLVFLITAAIFAASLLFSGFSFVRVPLYKALGIFLLAMTASAVFSERVWVSVVKLAGVGYLTGLAVLSVNVVRSRKMLKTAVMVWIAASTLVCLIGFFTVILFYVDRSSAWHSYFLHHYGSLPVGNYPRIQSTFFYPAMLCNYLTVGVMLTLSAVKIGWIKTKVAAAMLGLHAVAAVFTFTPGLGGLFFAITAWFGFAMIGARSFKAAGGLFALGTLVFLASIAVSAFSVWPIATSPYSFDVLGFRIDPTQRWLVWRDSLRTFFEHPIFGKGIGLGVAAVRFQPPSGQMQMLTDAHNSFLSVAAQAGILGLAAFAGMLAAIGRRAVKALTVDVELRPLQSAMLIALGSGFAIQGMTGSFEDARHLWVLAGMIVAACRIGSGEGAKTPTMP